MAKLIGTIRITPNAGNETTKPHFEVTFVPFAGRLETRAVKLGTYDDLVSFLVNIRLSEDEASRWAGKARSEGTVLIAGIERHDTLLREIGLLA